MGDPSGWAGRQAIIHADLDCFFAAVEVLDDPSLRGIPVIVGGSGRRGVVATANYEARIYGVHSAMSMVEARGRCPQARIISGNYARYRELSHAFVKILEETTPEIEVVSVDEAFLSVRGSIRRLGPPGEIAAKIRADVMARLGLSVCLGVGSSKQIAKLASRRAKPKIVAREVVEGSGVVVVEPGSELEFLRPIRIDELWGVGPKLAQRFHQMGVRTVSDLWEIPDHVVLSTLGNVGLGIKAASLGKAHDTVQIERATKSISQEETFAYDLYEGDEIDRALARLADALAHRLHRAEVGGRTIELKVRDALFKTRSRSRTLAEPISDFHSILEIARQLVPDDLGAAGVRLLGIGASKLARQEAHQLSLEDATGRTDSALEATLHEIKARFGEQAVASASLLDGDRVRVRHSDLNRWGPSDRPSRDTGDEGR